MTQSLFTKQTYLEPQEDKEEMTILKNLKAELELLNFNRMDSLLLLLRNSKTLMAVLMFVDFALIQESLFVAMIVLQLFMLNVLAMKE